MNMWVVALREIRVRARSRAFRISTALILLGVVVGIALPAMLAEDAKTYQVAVSGGADVSAAVTTQAATMEVAVEVTTVGSRADAMERLSSGTVDAALIDIDEILWKTEADDRLAPVLQSAAANVALTRRAAEAGLDPQTLATLFTPHEPVTTELNPPTAGPINEEQFRERGPRVVVSMIGMVLLFVALNMFGGYVLSGVVEEKSNRVVEVLLARVNPRELLAGKVIGIGLLGIGQFVALAAAAVATLYATGQMGGAGPLSGIPVSLIAGLVMWFILGYAFYSVLYGALGALASRMEDAQGAIAPVTILMMLGYFGAFFGTLRPADWWVTAGSLFPPTAPLFMPIRSAIVDVPAWQTAAAIVLMLITVPLMVALGGRLYRGAVLSTGGRLKISQAWARSK